MTEKRFHPFAVLHLLRKTILVYLLPLVQVLFARNWAALWAALAQDVLLLALLSMVCWEVLRVSGWQMAPTATCWCAGGWASGWTAPCGRTCWLP